MQRKTPLFTLAALLLLATTAQAGWFGPVVDPVLVAQVPFDKRAAITAADFELSATGEELKLAQMQYELADLQRDFASTASKLAKANVKAAELALDIARLEAVDAQGLGVKADNLKTLGELRSDKSKNEAEIHQLTSKLRTTDLMVRDNQQRVAAREKDVAAFRARKAAGTSGNAPTSSAKPNPATPAPPAIPATPSTPTTVMGEVISETPSPDPIPATPALPEGDLKN